MVLYGVCTKKLGQLGLKGSHPGRAVVFKGGATIRSASSMAGDKRVVEMRRGWGRPVRRP